MGGYPPHSTGPGFFSIPGGATTDGAAATAEVGWEMWVHLGGGGNIGGRVIDNGTYIWQRQNMVAQYIVT